jgi:hypothetical protein
MRKCLFALVMLAGCGGAAEQPGGNQAVPASGAERSEQAAKGASRQAIGTSRLTGLYEGGSGERRNQLCILDKGTGNAQFGIVVWGAGLNSCSGAGQAVREGEVLRLQMAGDSECSIRAAIDGPAVKLPAELPAGCDYYCGAGARFSGAEVTRAGSTAQDAMKAKDIVGDPLCESRDP